MESPHDIYRKDKPAAIAPTSRRGSSESPESATGASQTPSGPGANKDFYHRGHRRRHKHSNEHSTSRLVSLVLLAIAIVYAMAWVAILAKKHPKGRKLAEEPPAPAAASATNAAQEVSAPTGFDMASRIAAWKRIPDAILEAQAFADRGDYAEASRRVEAALEQCPQALRLKMLLARIHYQREDYTHAAEILMELLEANPDDFAARTLLASVFAHQADWENALTVAKWILDANPSSTPAHDIAAQAYLATDRKALAIPHLKKIVTLEKDNIVAQNKLGRAYADLGEYVKAIQVFNDVLAQNDNDATTFYNLAACYARQGLAEDAATVLSRAAPRFGNQFVAAWVQNPEFENIRSNRIITALIENLSLPPGNGSATNSAR